MVLVAHSNAGLLLPVIAAALSGQVLGCSVVGAAPVAPPERLAQLRDQASGGRLRTGEHHRNLDNSG